MAAVIFGVATRLFYVYAGDEMAEAIATYYAQELRQSGLPPEELAKQLAEMESWRPWMTNPLLQGGVMAATVFPIGVVESLIGAAILRWRR